ncbi:LRRN4 C-terminal-like protein [Discoglossus pictus]
MSDHSSKTQISLVSPLLLLLLPFCLMTSGAPATSAPAITTEGNSSRPWTSNSTESWDSTSAPLTTAAPTEDINETVPEPSVPPLPEVTRSRQTTQDRIVFISGEEGDDYYEDDDYNDKGVIPTQSPIPDKPCEYNRCKHLEPSCKEIQNMEGGKCMCPGVDGPHVRPDTPRLGQILSAENGASVNWCSPLSTVLGYRVLYGSLDGPMEQGPDLNSSYRMYSIGHLSPDTTYRVCVVAFNAVGHSSSETGEEEETVGWEGGKPGPCRIFRTSSSQETNVYLGVGVGLAALAGVLGLSVLGWWLWRRGKDRRRKEDNGDRMGVPNLSYKAESVEQL